MITVGLLQMEDINMKVYIFQNNYYIGECQEIIDKAIRFENVELEENEEIKVVDGVLEIIEKE